MSLLLLDTKVFYGPFDISGDLNKVLLNYGADAKDKTTFGTGGTRIHQGGLKNADFSMGGLMQEDTEAVGKVIFDRVGVSDVLLSAVPEGNTYGDVAYFFKALKAQFSPGGSVGELYAFNASAKASGHQPLVRGRLEVPRAVYDATGASAGSQLGLVAAGKRIYVALHVFAVEGTSPTLDVVLESDNASNFASATSRIAMTQATDVTSELKSLAGAIATDDYWRITYTLGGTDPSFDFAVAIGVL